jgi:hypothetical protein
MIVVIRSSAKNGARYARSVNANVRLRLLAAAAPHAAHARYNHGAAWPIFRHIGGVAHPHGIRAWIIARIDVIGFGLITRIDTKPARRPLNGLRCGLGGGRTRLRQLCPRGYGLRPGPSREQENCSCQGPRYDQSSGIHLDARPDFLIVPTVSDCRDHVNNQDHLQPGERWLASPFLITKNRFPRLAQLV